MKSLVACILLLTFFCIPMAVFGADGFKVVGHSATTPDSISKRDLTRIFLKRKTTWPDRTAAAPVDQGRISQIREEFTREIMDKTIAMVESHWQAQVFSGRSSPPRAANSDAEVIEYVRANRGAVGYVSANTPSTDLKTISILD